MPSQRCEQCDMPYGDLLRTGKDHLFVCRDCGRESCDGCIVCKPSGPQTWFLHCPHCSGHSLDKLDLSERFNFYSSIAEIKESQHAIAILFIPRSVYPKRNESLIREAIPKLKDFDPSFFLLNENDSSIRNTISDWFPSICNREAAIGNGAVILLQNGQPVASLHGGPYLTKFEILECARTAWV